MSVNLFNQHLHFTEKKYKHIQIILLGSIKKDFIIFGWWLGSRG